MKDRIDQLQRRLAAATRLRPALLPMLAVCVACGDAGRTATDQDPSVWTTEAEYQLGGAYETGVWFERPLVRIDPERNRVLVADASTARISVWTPEGELTSLRGRMGEGLGAFGGAGGLFVEEDGTLSVMDGSGSRFAYFAADGEHTRTQLGPGTSLKYEGMSVRLAPPRDGVYLGAARVPPAMEAGVGPFAGVGPVLREPLLRVGRSDTGEWLDPEPLLWLDISNRIMFAEYPHGGMSFGGQFFGDPDQVRFEPGSAIVMRTKGGPGSVELIEVDGAGDTVWHRRLQLEPRAVTPEMVDEVLEDWLDIRAPSRAGRPTRQEFRDVFYEALYKPEYLPAAEGRPIPTSSGEIWFRTHEFEDDLRVHYAVRRGDMDEPPRRVLLPEWLRVNDATETHVWGVRQDEMEGADVVGRRLVPVS